MVSGLDASVSTSLLQSLNGADAYVQVIANQLASGSMGSNVGAANQAIAAELDATAESDDQASENAEADASLLATADGALGSISDIVDQMGVLAVQAGNATLSQSNRQAISQAYQALAEQINQVAATANYNGTPLLSGADIGTFQVGPTAGAASQLVASLPAISAQSLGLANSDPTAVGGAGATLARLDDAMGGIAAARGALGAQEASLASAQGVAQTASYAAQAAGDAINATDYAQVTAAYQQAMLQQSAGAAALVAYERQAIGPLTEVLAS